MCKHDAQGDDALPVCGHCLNTSLGETCLVHTGVCTCALRPQPLDLPGNASTSQFTPGTQGKLGSVGRESYCLPLLIRDGFLEGGGWRVLQKLRTFKGKIVRLNLTKTW